MLSLRKPHPFIFNYKSVLIPGIITFLVITLFAPFAFREMTPGIRIIFGAGFCLLASLSIVLVVTGIKKIFPKWVLEDNWTLGREIILFIFAVITVCLLTFACFLLFGLSELAAWPLFRQVVVYTTLISILPIIILVLYEQYSFQRQRARQAIQLTQRLKETGSTPGDTLQPNDFVLFEAENGKAALRIPCQQVLFLKAEGNYVEVYYHNQHREVRKKLIRNRLKRLLEVLPQRQFFRAHKSYIVNGNQIERVEGNARNFELVLQAVDVRLPVSRSRSEELSAFLKMLP